MSEWNAMTYEGKDTILRVVRQEAERLFALAEEPERLGGADGLRGLDDPRRRRPHRRHDRGLLRRLRRGARQGRGARAVRSAGDARAGQRDGGGVPPASRRRR